jgi:molecular chaperone GrpE
VPYSTDLREEENMRQTESKAPNGSDPLDDDLDTQPREEDGDVSTLHAGEDAASRVEVERLQGERDQLLDLALRSQGTAEQLRSGVDLIVRQMEEIVRTLGVQPVPTVETQFDPRLHEAIEMVERDDLPDHQVMEEVRRGYTLRDRLIRPAMVRVATNSKQKTA